MRVFGTEPGRLRGCFAAFDIDVGGSEGAVLRLPESRDIQTLPRREEGGPFNYGLVVTDLTFAQKELLKFLRCFGGRVYTYAFGADLGDLTVQFAGYLAGGVSRVLGADDTTSQFTESTVVTDYLTAYRQSRISASRKLAVVSFGGSSLSGFIIGMQSRTLRAESNMQVFTMRMKLVSVQGATTGANEIAQINGAGAGPTDTIGANLQELADEFFGVQ